MELNRFKEAMTPKNLMKRQREEEKKFNKRKSQFSKLEEIDELLQKVP